MGTLAGFPYLTDPWVVIGVNLDAIRTVTEGRSTRFMFMLVFGLGLRLG